MPFTDTADIVGLGFSAFSSSRNIVAFYGEVNAPVLKQLELNAAVRIDKYSDYGRSTTTKVGFKYTPIPQFAVRGTYSEAFRAPGRTESGNSSSLGFTNFAIISIGDPTVKPEKSKSYTFGLSVEPVPGTSASLDYYQIKRRDEIMQADQASIIGSAPQTSVPSSRIAGALLNSFVFLALPAIFPACLGRIQTPLKPRLRKEIILAQSATRCAVFTIQPVRPVAAVAGRHPAVVALHRLRLSICSRNTPA